MDNNILELNGLSLEKLQKLSFRSKLGISLKNTLHHFDKVELLNELFEMVSWLNELDLFDEIDLDYRIKSIESIEGKYQRYIDSNRQTRQIFNDILGFRGFCDDYEEVRQFDKALFHIADMTEGKANDDGYRGIHVYYEVDNFTYPIEIQFNTLYDRQLNNWLHDYLYKKDYPNEIGKLMRKEYESGYITDVSEFEEVLKNVLSGS
jgi:putative GTP pyrophosphokinase